MDETCFAECSSIPCDNWKTLFFIKVYHYTKGFWNRHIVAFFEISVLKEVCTLNYVHNIITTLIPKFLIKFVVYDAC